MNEVAHATVCFSRAWREGLYGVKAYWVYPEQVKNQHQVENFFQRDHLQLKDNEILSIQEILD